MSERRLSIQLTEEQYQKIVEGARKNGRSMSAHLLMLARLQPSPRKMPTTQTDEGK